MKINTTDESHADHLSAEILALVLSAVEQGESQVMVPAPTFQIHVVTLPAGMTVHCALRGPATGEAPVSESDVFYGSRNGRPNVSRLTRLPSTQDNRVTVLIGRETEDEDWSLITAFGGPLAPQEPSDPFLPAEKHAEAVAFWGEHALSMDGSPEASIVGASFETFSAPAKKD